MRLFRTFCASLLVLPAAAFAGWDMLPRLGDVAGAVRLAAEGARTMASAPAAPRNPWAGVSAPSRGTASSIGFYSAGCLAGADALERDGEGYQTMRLARRRYYGHPRLTAFLRDLGKAAKARGLGTLLIGDLGQPRGGPTLTGHASHQNGLDVDVWFRQWDGGRELTDDERQSLSAPSMVAGTLDRLNEDWDPRVLDALELAAGDPAVDRIFVNPVVKKEACDRRAGQAWLRRLRPWWGHDDHFHARLSCASGDGRCRAQEAVPSGDGCEELAGWLSPEAIERARRRRGGPSSMPSLPAACAQVLRDS